MTVLTARLVGNKGPESVARLVLAKHAAVPWQAALDYSVQWWEGFVGGGASPTNAWQALNQSLNPANILVFHNGKIQTLYGLRFRVTTRSVALMGERRTGAVAALNPQMYQHAGSLASQSDHLNTLEFRPPPLEAAIEALATAGDSTTIDPIMDGEDNVVKVPAILPVHPKLGALFLDGLLPHGALVTTRAIRDANPTAPAATELLTNFCLAAATTGRDSGMLLETSVLGSNRAKWTRLDPFEDQALLEYYFEYLEVTLPTPPTPQATPSPALASPSGPSEELLAALMGRVTGDLARSDKDADGKKYLASDLDLLNTLCGVDPDTRDGELTISEFFRDFRPIRSQAKTSRRFVENFRLTRIETDVEYPFFWSTQMVTDLRHLDFGGGDQRFLWEDRYRGVSLFSWAPAEETASYTAARDRMLAYEDTEAMHSPGERQTMAKLSGNGPDPPVSRQRLWNWIDHFRAMTRVVFGNLCPLIGPLSSIRRMLSNAPLFGAWRVANYANLTWRIHIGIRHFFNSGGGLQALIRVANDLTALHHFGDGGAPDEYVKAPKLTPENPKKRQRQDDNSPNDGGHVGSGSGGSGSGGSGNGPSKKQKGEVSGAPFAKAWQAHLERARKAAPPGAFFNATAIAPDQQARDALMGPELIQRVSGEPCFRHFIMGKCASDPCRQSHIMNGTLPANVLEEIKARVTARVDQLIANPLEYGRATGKR